MLEAEVGEASRRRSRGRRVAADLVRARLHEPRGEVHDVAEHRVLAPLRAARGCPVNARPVVTPAPTVRPSSASASTIARAASDAAGRVVLVGPVGQPPRGDEREALVVVDDLVEAALVAVDDGLRRSGTPSGRAPARRARRHRDRGSRRTRPSAAGTRPASPSGRPGSGSRARGAGRMRAGRSEAGRSTDAVAASPRRQRCHRRSARRRRRRGPGPSVDRRPAQPAVAAAARGERRAGPAAPARRPARRRPAAGRRRPSATRRGPRRRRRPTGRPIAMPARARTWMPSTGGRPRAAAGASRARHAAAPTDRSISRSVGPDREDRVAGEAHDVAAVGVDPVDDVAERGVEDRASVSAPPGPRSASRSVRAVKPVMSMTRTAPRRPPAVGPGRVPSVAGETPVEDRRDERSEGPLRHPREDTRVCDTPAHECPRPVPADRGGGPSPMADVRRIAILGGGMASLLRPLELTQRAGLADALRDHRLPDGLAARRQGRERPQPRLANGRIEEHGLHVWFGCYDNAFRLLRGVLRGAAPAGRLALRDAGRGLPPAERDAVFRVRRRGMDGLAAVVPAGARPARHRRADAVGLGLPRDGDRGDRPRRRGPAPPDRPADAGTRRAAHIRASFTG